jgi:hypothetical protein
MKSLPYLLHVSEPPVAVHRARAWTWVVDDLLATGCFNARPSGAVQSKHCGFEGPLR